MKNSKNAVLNGTNNELTHDVGLVDTVNSDKKINVTVYQSDCQRFLSQYTAFAVKTAQSTVEMCRVVQEAKVGLSKSDFLKFCAEIGHKSDDATIRKYLAIGAAYSRLISYANLLPNSWTSIYEITQIPADAFDALVKTGNSMATLTGAQVKRLKELNNKSDAAATVTDAGAATTTSDADAAMNVTDTATATTVTDAGADPTTSENAADPVVTDVAASPAAPTVNVAAEPAATDAIDDSCDEDAAEFAQQATASLLDRVSQKTVAEVAIDEPYEFVIRFNRKPPDAAIHVIVDAIMSVQDKHHIDVEIIHNRQYASL